MSLQLIIGGSGSGKTEYLCRQVIEQSLQHPDCHYLVIVPEQATLQTQMMYVKKHPRKGLLNIDVLSFQRLAHRVLEEAGADRQIVLRDTGKNLLLRKGAGEIREQLTVFSRNFKRVGYISELKSLLSELAQYRIGPGELREMMEISKDRGSLYYKLQDVALLQEKFRELLGETYVTNEELLERLCRYVPDSKLLQDAVLVFDGFTGFTPVQESLLEALFRRAKDLYFTAEIGGDSVYKKTKSTRDLFHLSREMVEHLTRIAGDAHTEILEPVILKMPCPRWQEETADLAHMEQYLFRRKPMPYQNTTGNISIHTNRNPMEEARFVASSITGLVRENSCRYRDMGVIISSMNEYADAVEYIFREWNIPFFMDHKRNALENAAVEFVRSSISMVEERLSYESVFRFLKSGFYPMDPMDLYLLENYVLAMDIKGFGKWEDRFIRKPRDFSEEKLQRVEELRRSFMEFNGDFFEALRKRGRTVRSCSEALYRFLRTHRIEEQLEQRREQLEEEGQALLAKEYAQIYRLLIELLDEYVSLLGEEQVTVEEYRELLDAGLGELRIGVIPPGQDQVMVGDLERTRLSDIKYLFCIGMNDAYLPGIKAGTGILNDRDRSFLSSHHIVLAPTQAEKIATQRFYLYLNMTKPSRHLYLSYSNVDLQGKTMQPAFYLREILRLFPDLQAHNEVTDGEKRDIALSEKSALMYLTKGLQEGWALQDLSWKELYCCYKGDGEREKLLDKILEAHFHSGRREKLEPAEARRIYGAILEASVSRLEKFARCPYAHFLQYGLHLKEREVFAFEMSDQGSVMHDALYQLANLLEQKGYTLKSASEDLLRECCKEAMERAASNHHNLILNSTAQRNYLRIKMEETLEVTADALQKQLQQGNYEADSFELEFGSRKIRTLELPLEGDTAISFRGKIDRVDLAKEGNTTYVKIIDYKTGSKTLDLSAVYHGLELQLFLYLHVAEAYAAQQDPGSEILPGAVLYYQIQNPLQTKKIEDPTERSRIMLQKLRPRGMFNEAQISLEQFDRKYSEAGGYTSDVIPITRNKDGSLKKGAAVMSAEEFRLMEAHLLHKVRQQAGDILRGEIGVSPATGKDIDACKYCEYKAICSFDEKLPNCTRREYPSLDKETILLKLHAEEDTDA